MRNLPVRLSLFIYSQFYFSRARKTFWNKVRLQNFSRVFLCIHLFLLRLLTVNHVSWPAVHYGKPFCSGKFSLVQVHWNNGDHFWEGVQESFQLKWLPKFLRMRELKNFIFEISQWEIRSLFLYKCNNIIWIGFYRPIKLRLWMGQNAGYFDKANQRSSFFLFSFKKIASKINKRVILSYLL